MTFNEARDLRIGEKVKRRNDDHTYEVFSLNEFISATDGKKIIYVKCKTPSGGIMKFSHKELVVVADER